MHEGERNYSRLRWPYIFCTQMTENGPLYERQRVCALAHTNDETERHFW